MFKKFVVFFVASLLFYSCSSTNELTISVTEPAPVYIPKEVTKIGIINRSEPTENSGLALDIADKLFSGEGMTLDKDGADAATKAVFEELKRMNKFNRITIINNASVEGNELSSFPSAISWKDIERICRENNVEVIYELSFYDTDTDIDYDTRKTEVKTPLGDVPALHHYAHVTTFIKSGWRIYDATNNRIADEIKLNDRIMASGSGINPVKAIEAITGRKAAVIDISTQIGIDYAQRILPYRHRVSRVYFVKGNDNFEKAKRRAQTGDWDGAAELWTLEVDNPDDKIAGRACYNMAIINEINGDLEKAIEWASKAYADYEIKEGMRYTKILRDRVRKNEMLE